MNGKWRRERRPYKITVKTKLQPTSDLTNCLDWAPRLKKRRQAWRNLAREGGKGDAPSLSLNFLPKKLKTAWLRKSVPANSTYKAGSKVNLSQLHTVPESQLNQKEEIYYQIIENWPYMEQWQWEIKLKRQVAGLECHTKEV